MEFFSPQDGAEKAINVKKHQDWRTIFNSLVMCFFANLEPEQVLNLIRAASGVEWTLEEMLQAGERAWNLKRGINIRLGLRRANDRLPKAFLQAYQDASPEEAYVPNLEAMLEAYYQARQWDQNSGFPTPAKLAELNLNFLAHDLYGK